MSTTGEAVEVAIGARELFDIVGHRVAVGASAGVAVDAVRSILSGFGPHGAALGDDLPRFDLVATGVDWQVRVDDAVIHTGNDLLNALGTLESRLVNNALDRRDDTFCVHGAALCLPTEPSGMVLVGQSGFGKTTLATALMLRGFSAFSDDVALIDPQSLGLQPLRRAFHLDDNSRETLQRLSPGAFTRRHAPVGYFCPPQWAERSVPVQWILFPQYQPGQQPGFELMSPSEAAVALLAEALTLGRASRMALSTTGRLIDQARCLRFHVGDIVESVTAVQQLVMPR